MIIIETFIRCTEAHIELCIVIFDARQWPILALCFYFKQVSTRKSLCDSSWKV